MGFSIWNLFKAGLLTTNAMLILNRRRFLAKYGLHDVHCIPSENPMKVQLIGILQAVRYINLPVICSECAYDTIWVNFGRCFVVAKSANFAAFLVFVVR